MEPGSCAPRVRATYSSVILVLLAFGALRLFVLSSPLEGIAILCFGIPGALALFNIWAPTMRVWHVGGCALWVAYCAYNIDKLVSSPASADWVVYVGAGTSAALCLLLCMIQYLSTSPSWSAWRARAAGPLLPQHANESLASIADQQPQPETAGEPLVWPPPAHPLNAQADGTEPRGDGGEDFANSATVPAAIWPPPGYTGN
jgi:hypothetical protein